MKLATLKRILYAFCGVAYTMLGLCFVFWVMLLPILTPVINGQIDHQAIQFGLVAALLAIVCLVPGILLFVVAIGHTRLLSSPKRAQYLLGGTAFTITVVLSLELWNRILGGGIGVPLGPLGFSVTLPLFYFGLLALIAVVHDVVVCHKHANESLHATAAPPST